MVQLALAFVAAALVSVQASPLHEKRIAQVVADSLVKWQAACVTSGGSLTCNDLAVSAYNALLASAGPCDQQNAADSFINLAKQLSNSTPEMISLSQVFAQQPRNSPSSDSVPYCQQAPKNSELKGLYQCQWVGNSATFVGGLAVGVIGTIPFNMGAPVNPPGSCPAHPEGGIADGTQLVDITTNPGNGGSSAAPTTISSSPSESAPSTTATALVASLPTSSTTTMAASPASSSSSFQAANAVTAQNLNAQYASLTPDSPCQAGEDACVNKDFAQCVNGKFVLTPCASGLQCFALPLVLTTGTSIACDTKEDAIARGGLTS